MSDLQAPKQLMTQVQQAELQGKLWTLVEDFRTKHGLSFAAIFKFGMCFFWGYARRQNATHQEIHTNARVLFDSCEAAYNKARPQDGHSLPG